MRPFVLALLALLLVPVSAAGKEPDAPVRVLWNSAPDDVRARGTWDARLSLLQGPGGFNDAEARPVIVVTELASGAERHVAMVVDVPPNTFRGTVAFPRAGLYRVAVEGFDPRDPARLTSFGRAVHIEPALARAAAAPDAGGAAWPWALAVTALLAGAWCIQRIHARATG